jgi:hypothetical protein
MISSKWIALMSPRGWVWYSPSDLDRQARERHQCVHEVGVAITPHPGMHSAHRRAHDEPKVTHAELFGEKPVVGGDHVVVRVLGKLHMQAVAGPARLAVADAIGEDDEVPGRVQQPALAEELAREVRSEEPAPAAGRAMKDEHGVGDVAL